MQQSSDDAERPEANQPHEDVQPHSAHPVRRAAPLGFGVVKPICHKRSLGLTYRGARSIRPPARQLDDIGRSSGCTCPVNARRNRRSCAFSFCGAWPAAEPPPRQLCAHLAPSRNAAQALAEPVGGCGLEAVRSRQLGRCGLPLALGRKPQRLGIEGDAGGGKKVRRFQIGPCDAPLLPTL